MGLKQDLKFRRTPSKTLTLSFFQINGYRVTLFHVFTKLHVLRHARKVLRNIGISRKYG